MSRTILTNPFPTVPDDIPPRPLVITPHRAAAETLSVGQRSLQRLATDVLKEAAFSVASQIEALATLKEAISTTVTGADTSALAARIKQILETLLRTGIDIDDLEDHGSAQVKQLARIAREYRRRLRADRLVDNSEIVWQAAALNPEPRTLCIYGHFRARKEEIFFINAIAGEGSIYYLPCGTDPIFNVNVTWANWLVSKGQWEIDRAHSEPNRMGERAAKRFTGKAADDLRFEALAYPNVETEVRGVLGESKRLINSGIAPSEIAIVCRDPETYAPLLSSFSSEFGIRVEMRHKIPLISTLFGGFVTLLMKATISRFDFETTARLLMHPLGPGLSDGGLPIARKQRLEGAEAWVKVAGGIGCLEWREEAPLSEWTDCLTGALRSLNVRKRAGKTAREIVAYNLFLESLGALVAVEPKAQMTREQFWRSVMELLSDVDTRFDPSAGGISIHSPDTISGARYRSLFVLGMAEGTLPGAVVDNPVIDFYERKKLIRYGIEFEEATEVARWSALSFYFTLLTADERLSLSYPVTIDDAEKIPNSYFSRLGVEPRLTDSNCISSVSEQRRFLLRTSSHLGADETLALARKQFSIEKARESIEIADEYDGSIGIKIDPFQQPWSASQFTSIGQCPFKWFAQKLLKLRPAEEMDISLSASMKGSLYHKVLEFAIEHAKDAENVRAAAIEVLESCFKRAEVDEDLGLPVLANWNLQRQEHLQALRKAIESDTFLEMGARIIAVEQQYKTEWNGFTITGRIDRIDETARGLIPIDYKTSSSVSPGIKNAAGKTLVDIQLSLYSTVALPALYPGKPVIKGVYYSLTKGKVLKKIEPPDPSSLEELINTMHGIMSTGRFIVDPDVDGNACKYCDYDRLCRKGARLDRKSKGE